ncbi:MAG: succinate dehydrogenase cytochrome b subunit [Bdellovibrionales bacterium]|nr:succinate dehydrogenase cytochrome b subunit [Bdellovibrionales bacterium]
MFRSSIGRKYLMGLTGLGWIGFVLMHMLGNMLILVSPEAYNKYGHAIVSNPLLPAAEIGLVVMLLVHVVTAISLTIDNKRARPESYKVGPSSAKAATLASRTMAYSGTLILAFIILHITTFKYGTFYSVNYNGVEMRDLHRLIVEVFHNPGYVAWYVVCLILLGVHLSHGFSSSFQSLGLNHPKYNGWLKCGGCAISLIIAAGFLSQPLYVFFLAK